MNRITKNVLTNRIHQLVYLITFAFVTVSTLSRLLFDGMVYNFDYFVYQPDGALYTHMALTYSGLSSSEATKQVMDWYAQNAKPGLSLTPDFFDPTQNSSLWALVSIRIVYPLLSTPFVYFLGIPGMLVVPVISYGILIFLILRVAVRLNNLYIGLVLVFLLTISTTVSRWYIANITDGLLTTLVALALYVLLVHERLRTLSLLVLISLGSFTRFSLPIWLAVALFLVLKRERITGLIAGIWSLFNFIPALLQRPDLSFITPEQQQTLPERVVEFAWEAARLVFVEISQLAALDRPLLILLLAALLLSVLNPKHESSQFFLLMLLAVWFIGFLNPVLGVNFRYQLPIIAFACWTILDKLKIQRDGSVGNILYIVRNKTQ